MGLKQAILMTITCALLHNYCAAQRKYSGLLFGTVEYRQTDTGLIQIHYKRVGCKNYVTQNIAETEITMPVVAEAKLKIPKPNRVKFLTIHGNVSYDFIYRSRIDTPYAQTDLQQHTEKIWLDVMVKEKYPIRVGFTARQSNSPLFRNFLDANFQFDKNVYQRRMKQELEKKIIDKMPEQERLKLIEKALEQEKQKLQNERGKLANPSRIQQMIEEKEKAYRNTIDEQKKEVPGNDIVKGSDSVVNKLLQKKAAVYNSAKTEYEKERKKIDSLQKSVQQLMVRADSLRKKINGDIFKIKQKLNKAGNSKELADLAKEHGVYDEHKTNGLDKFLSSVNTLSVGRSMLDYTELTAQHIMISGVNIEVNPSYYAAFAVGKINYRFRDFLNRDLKSNNQYLLLGRFGIGDKNKKAVIFTLFQGRKSQSEFAISDTISNDINITGYSVEAIIKKDAFNFLSAEFAKSTRPFSGSANQGKQANALFKFSDERNMGINIKGETRITKTNTRLGGYFRRTGHQFQSFSLFSYNSNQTAWQARVEQVLWKNKVSITGMLRQNDFSNIFTEKTYKASTIFKSALLNVRIPKYPYLSLGYYPGTQLYIIDKDRVRENAYYILNASMVYSYRYKGTAMTSSFMYNRYINQASDSGFVLYKGVNYYASQNIFLRKLQLQGGYAYNSQPQLVYHTIDASGDVNIRKWLKAGAGIKYNTVKGGDAYFGQRMQLSVTGKWLGGLQLQYEKSYLPTIGSILFPVETGRIMWFKNF